MPAAHTKAAKRRNRRAWNTATRAQEAALKRPRCMGLVEAAEAAVEDADRERERREAKAQSVKRDKVRQTPMERYKQRGEITEQQFADAERLWSDWVQSGLFGPVTGKYEVTVPSGGQFVPGTGPRYTQYQDAMKAVGIILSPVLTQVVLAGEPASLWAVERGRPAAEGIVTLRLALEALGAHYRERA